MLVRCGASVGSNAAEIRVVTRNFNPSLQKGRIFMGNPGSEAGATEPTPPHKKKERGKEKWQKYFTIRMSIGMY